jgi:ubiquinone/menaquinone biosynthesis C-methylase UbiE
MSGNPIERSDDMATMAPTIEMLKAGMRAGWTTGDFGKIAHYEGAASEELLDRLGLRPGDRVLDVACGPGKVALAAARSGANVTGIDFAPNLLAQARSRAAAEGLAVRFDEGDAEALPYGDGTFDIVVSTFGVMFATRPTVAAAELVRVCRPGGRIAILSWTPHSIIGQLFLFVCEYAPPPPGVAPPIFWGIEEKVREYLGEGIADLRATTRVNTLAFPFGPAEVAELYIANLGAIHRAHAGLTPDRQAAFRNALTQFFADNNRSCNAATTRLEAEYLEVLATRA